MPKQDTTKGPTKFNPLSFGYTVVQWKALDAHERMLICKRAYRLRNSEKIIKAKAKHRAENKEKIAAADAAYREKNRATINAKARAVSHLRAPKTPEQRERKRETDRKAYYADLAKARARRRAWYHDNIDKARARKLAWHHKNKSVQQVRLSPDEIWMRIDKAVNRGLPRHVRDDVIGMMALAVLEGKLMVDKIESGARSFVTAYNRDNRVFDDLSLDAPIGGGDGSFTLLDVLTGKGSEDDV